MLRPAPLLLVVLPLAGAAAWIAQFWAWPDPQLDRPWNLLPLLPLALPALITLAARLRAASLRLALLWAAYAGTLTVAFAVIGVLAVFLFADDSANSCPNHRIYC